MNVRIILLTGPSGCGKTSLTRRLGVPVISLDDFYRDEDAPGLPRRFGIVDWDDPASWDAVGAFEALQSIATTGTSKVPIYDIPSSHRTGMQTFSAGTARVVIAEGIFASELVKPCQEAGFLASAICLSRSPWTNFWFRLLRDIAESRKSLVTLVRRGNGLRRAEPAMVKRWIDQGCAPMGIVQAEAEMRSQAGI